VLHSLPPPLNATSSAIENIYQPMNGTHSVYIDERQGIFENNGILRGRGGGSGGYSTKEHRASIGHRLFEVETLTFHLQFWKSSCNVHR
jgi:hypothetical protein